MPNNDFNSIFAADPTEDLPEITQDQAFNAIPDLGELEVLEPSTDSNEDVEEKVSKESKKTENSFGDNEAKKDEEVEEVSDFSNLISQLVDEDIIPKEGINFEDFGDDVQGVKDLIKTLPSKYKEAGKEEFLSSLSDKARRVIELEQQGVDISKVLELENEEVDFSALSDEDLADLDVQKNLYFDYLIATGISQERASKMVEKAENSDSLSDYTDVAIEYLDKAQKTKKDSLIRQQTAQRKLEDDKLKQEEESFRKEILATKDIRGFSLEEKEVKKLYDYMTKVDPKSGKTQEMIDFEKNAVEARKAFAYLQMTGFDFSKLEKKATTKATIKLKKIISNQTDKGTSSKGTKTPSTDSGDLLPFANSFK